MSTLKTKLQDMLPSKTNGILLKNIYNAKNTIVTTAKCEVLKLTKKTISLMKKITKDDPVLLLDDVLSELDGERQNYLLNSIGNIQTIITCTGLDEFIDHRFAIDRVFKISEGSVVVGNEGINEQE